MQNQFDDWNNESAANSFLQIIGRMGANRLKLELLDDATDKAESIKFDNNHILTKKFLACKSKSKIFIHGKIKAFKTPKIHFFLP